MRTPFWTAVLFAFSAAAFALDAGVSVDPQPGGGAFRVRVVTNPPVASSPAGTGAPASPDPAGSGSVVTIEEFPGLGRDDDGGAVVSEPLEAEPRVLATLYGEPITEDDVTREMWLRRGRETFEWILGREILRRELRRLRLEVSEAEIRDSLEKHLAVLRKNYPNLRKDDDLARAASGMAVDEYRERAVWSELALRKIMHVALETRDEDLRVYFAAVRADFIRPERIRLSQIFIAPAADADDGVASAAAWAAAESEAARAHAMLRQRDFGEVAKAFGAGGGLSRWVRRGDLLRELEDAAFAIEPGSVTSPIKSSVGWHILMVEEREERAEPTLEEVREEVAARYEEERFVRLAGEFMARLREKTLETGGLVVVDAPSVFDDAEPRE